MKLEKQTQDKTEMQQCTPIKKQLNLLGSIAPHENHTLFEYNSKTNVLSKATFYKRMYHMFSENNSVLKKSIIVNKDCIYHSCLNFKNAVKCFSKMLGREIEPIIKN